MKTIPIPEGYIAKNITRMGNIIITEIEKIENKEPEYVMRLDVDTIINKLRVVINDYIVLFINSDGKLVFNPPKNDGTLEVYNKWLTNGKKIDTQNPIRWNGYDWKIGNNQVLYADDSYVFDFELLRSSKSNVSFLKKYDNNIIIVH